MGQGVGVWATTAAAIGAAENHRDSGIAIGVAIGAAIGACDAKLSPQNFRAFAMTLLIFSLAILTQYENQRLGRIPGIFNSGQKTVHMIESVRSLDLHPAQGSNILLKSIAPFKNGWTPLFIASLVWNDHSLQIWVDGQNRLSPQQLTNMNYVISFTESGTKLLCGPELLEQ